LLKRGPHVGRRQTAWEEDIPRGWEIASQHLAASHVPTCPASAAAARWSVVAVPRIAIGA